MKYNCLIDYRRSAYDVVQNKNQHVTYIDSDFYDASFQVTRILLWLREKERERKKEKKKERERKREREREREREKERERERKRERVRLV